MRIDTKEKLQDLLLGINSVELTEEQHNNLVKSIELINSEPNEVNTMKYEEQVSVICSCLSEILVVNKFTWESNTDKNLVDEEFNFAIFVQGHYHSKPSFWQRLKYAYWHIRTGKIYLDELTLNKEETFKLFTFLKQYYV